MSMLGNFPHEDLRYFFNLPSLAHYHTFGILDFSRSGACGRNPNDALEHGDCITYRRQGLEVAIGFLQHEPRLGMQVKGGNAWTSIQQT